MLTQGATNILTAGSYANHSCEPNMCYQTAGRHGLVYRALRPIAQGEELCFSYAVVSIAIVSMAMVSIAIVST